MKQYLKIVNNNVLRKSFLVAVCICYSLFLHSQTETVSDIEGNVYKTINICTQKWMAENLKTTTYNDGTKIGYKADSASWNTIDKWYEVDSGYYCNGNFDSNTVSKHGRLYNWLAVNTNKLCPKGWHVPEHKDWLTLLYQLVHNGSDINQCSYFIAKSLASTSGWEPSTNPDVVGYNQETNNSTGFNALPSYCVYTNNFNSNYYYNNYYYNNYYNSSHQNGGFNFWSSSPIGQSNTLPDAAYAFEGAANTDIVPENIYNGLPVRCLKDEINEVDNISATIDAKNTFICNNDSVTLKAIVKDGVKPYHYAWNCFESHDSVYTVSPSQNTVYKLIVVDSMQCNATSSIYIKKEYSPKVKLPNDSIFCDTIHFKINLQPSPLISYIWQDSSTLSHYTISKPGLYSVSASNDCGMVSDSMKVELVKSPQFTLPTDTLIYDDKKITLKVGIPGNYHYLWQDNSKSSRYVISSSGIYSVTISDDYNCYTTKSINVRDDCFLDVPTAFSPNYDGLNDVLYPIGRNIDELKFCIFDRWGNKMFESHSIKDGWDGTFNGEIVESSTVMYFISAKTNCDGKFIEKKGNISIIR